VDKSEKTIREEGHAAHAGTHLVEGHTSEETPKGTKPEKEVDLIGGDKPHDGEITNGKVTGEPLQSEPEGSQSLPTQTANAQV